MKPETMYKPAFYSDKERQVRESALQVLPIVFDLLDIASIVDFGCGNGAWLHTAQQLRSDLLLTGVEGNWIRPDMIVCPGMELVRADIEESSVTLSRTYDLAMSLEVGEHLSERRADVLVGDMCAAAPRILFGAAIPDQGGSGHVNEQWQSYWAKKFKVHGYRPVDIIRPQVVRNPKVLPWYKNNILLYVRDDEYRPLIDRVIAEGKYDLFCTDMVVPEMYDSPGLRKSLKIARAIPGKVAHSLLWRARIGRA